MAQATGVTDSTDLTASNREDIVDRLFDASPTDAVITNAIGKAQKAKSNKHEWIYSELAASNANNAAIEGATFAFTDVPDATRVANHTQIFEQNVRISGTQQSIDSVADFGKLTTQVRRKNKEQKRDQEASFGSNNASVIGTSSVAAKSAGFRAILETNSNKGVGGADGGFNSGTGVFDAATDGTERAFTKAIMDNVLQSCWNEGSEPSLISLSGHAKGVFSGFMSDADVAQLRTNVTGNGQATIVGGVDMYVGDFGQIAVKANRHQDQSSAFFINPEYAGVSTLRKTKMITPAQNEDAVSRVILSEVTLEVGTEKAHGVAADLASA